MPAEALRARTLAEEHAGSASPAPEAQSATDLLAIAVELGEGDEVRR
jgi:hypothetical protein